MLLRYHKAELLIGMHLHFFTGQIFEHMLLEQDIRAADTTFRTALVLCHFQLRAEFWVIGTNQYLNSAQTFPVIFVDYSLVLLIKNVYCR